MSCFAQQTVQNPKIFRWIFIEDKENQKILVLEKLNQLMINIFA